MLNGFQDLFRTEAYTPRYLHYLRCVSSASPVIGVCPLNDRRIAVAYEDRLEIRNLHLEEIRHVVCSEFKVVGLATAGEKLLILHRNAANSYEVSMIDIELKNIKKLFPKCAQMAPRGAPGGSLWPTFGTQGGDGD